MLKQHSSFLKQSIALLDCLLIAIAYFISWSLVNSYKPEGLANPRLYWPLPIAFAAFYLYFAWSRDLFSILHFNWMRGLLRRLITIIISAGIVGAAILYILPDYTNLRTLYIVFTIVSFLFIYVEKAGLKYAFAWLRRHNRNTTPIILVGRGRYATQVARDMQNHPEWGFRIVKLLDLATPPGVFEGELRTRYIEEVFFCVPRGLTRNDAFHIDPYLQICEEMGRPARVFMNLPGATNFARWEFDKFMGYPTLLSHTVELDPDQLLFKRVFDLFGGMIGFALFAVMYPIVGGIIKVTDPKGPILFKQIRVGKNGKRFIIYKFRSMYADAEARKKELMAHNEAQGAIFKMKDDPRITPVGKIIRKLSIDEFPQFLNVIKGDMSLVGTRPPTPDEVAEYDKWHHRRISIKPGITGMWQVSGRSAIKNFDEIVRLDLRYIDNWSIGMDIRIILKTVGQIVFRRGEEAC